MSRMIGFRSIVLETAIIEKMILGSSGFGIRAPTHTRRRGACKLSRKSIGSERLVPKTPLQVERLVPKTLLRVADNTRHRVEPTRDACPDRVVDHAPRCLPARHRPKIIQILPGSSTI